MTQEDQVRVRGLSADLYSIGAEFSSSPVSDKSVVEQLLQLIETGEFRMALDVCRENRSSISAPELAFARGLCWLRLNQPHVAVEFLREAVRLSPGEPTFEATLLVALHKAGLSEELKRRTQQHASPSANPVLALLSAQLGYSDAQDLADHERRARYLELLATADRAIDLAKEAKADRVLEQLLGAVYLCVAMIHGELGQREAARQACLDALRVNPDNKNAVMLLGWLDFEQFPESRYSHIGDKIRNLTLSPGVLFESSGSLQAVVNV